MNKIDYLLKLACTKLHQAGIKSPQLDARILLAFSLKISITQLLASQQQLSEQQIKKFWELIELRINNYPIAYITGQKEFYNLSFCVDRHVLIPRPETEFIVEYAVSKRPSRVVDVGTGSGCIALSIKNCLPECQVLATDISADALKIARQNAFNLKLDVQFVRSDLIDNMAIINFFHEGMIITANLPYVDMSQNNSSIAFEPYGALFSEDKGTEHYRRFFKQLNQLNLTYGYKVVIEHDTSQSEILPEIASLHHFQIVDKPSQFVTVYQPKL